MGTSARGRPPHPGAERAASPRSPHPLFHGPALMRGGVPFEVEEPAAAHPVVPGLGYLATRIGGHVQVVAPVIRRRRLRVRARLELSGVVELRRIPRTTPGAPDEHHDRSFLSSVADRGRALLAYQHARAEPVE